MADIEDGVRQVVEAKKPSLSRNAVFLGIVSFLTDVSSEMTLTLMPLFLANVLKVSTGPIGIIEGVAESTASITKLFSGWFSDKLGKRKPLTLLGYGLSTFSKPFLYLAGSWWVILFIRFSDRLGKGVRTAPRDALIADSAPAHLQGLNFGFHRAADTAGAFVGLGLATAIIYVMQGAGLSFERATFQTLVLAGSVPAFLAVVVLFLFVKDIKKNTPEIEAPALISFTGLDARFKVFLVISLLFALGNSSDAFLVLRAQDLGLSVLNISLLLLGFNFAYSALSTPAGALSDKLGRRKILGVGWLLYSLVYLGFATASEATYVWVLYIIYGVYYAMTEGVIKALIADVVPAARRGTAYGAHSTVVGLAALPASIIAGVLWQGAGPWHGFGAGAPFYFGAILAILSAFLLLFWYPSPTYEAKAS